MFLNFKKIWGGRGGLAPEMWETWERQEILRAILSRLCSLNARAPGSPSQSFPSSRSSLCGKLLTDVHVRSTSLPKLTTSQSFCKNVVILQWSTFSHTSQKDIENQIARSLYQTINKPTTSTKPAFPDNTSSPLRNGRVPSQRKWQNSQRRSKMYRRETIE